MLRKRQPTALLAVALGLVALFVVACRQGSPEERAAAARARYHATINGWMIEERPAPDLTVDVVGTAMSEEEDEGEEETAAIAGFEESEAGPRDVILDIQLWHNSAEALPGITLDVTHADENERVKETYLVWVDTSRLARGEHVQINHRLEGIEVAPGDRFAADVRHPVPAADRGRYRELQVSGGDLE